MNPSPAPPRRVSPPLNCFLNTTVLRLFRQTLIQGFIAMKLDASEVAIQLVRQGRWGDAEAPSNERPRRVMLLDEIITGRAELFREIRKLLPSATLMENEGKQGDAMVQVDTEELELRKNLFYEEERKAGPMLVSRLRKSNQHFR